MHIMRYIFLTLMVVTLSPDRAAAAEASQPPPPGSPRAAAPPPQEGQTLTTGQADYSEDDSNFDDEEQAAPAGIPRIPKDQKIQLHSRVSTLAKNFGRNALPWFLETFGAGGGEMRIYGNVISQQASDSRFKVKWDIAVPALAAGEASNESSVGREWWSLGRN